MTQFFILIDETRRQNAINFLRGMNIAEVQSVEIKPYRKNRSGAQNRLLWSWYGILAGVTGYTTKELHEQFKVRLLGVEERTVYGKNLVLPKSSADLDTKEFTDFLTKIEMVAIEMGITLPHPDDYGYIMSSKPKEQVQCLQ